MICNICLNDKVDNEFSKNRKQCKKCLVQKKRKRYHEKYKLDPVFVTRRTQKAKEKKEYYKQYGKVWREKNRAKILANNKIYKKDNREKIVAREKSTRAQQKQKLVDLFGGKCQSCGYDKCLGALEFHHINPQEKLFSITRRKIQTKGMFLPALNEAKKCILICSNCHREIHAGLKDAPSKLFNN